MKSDNGSRVSFDIWSLICEIIYETGTKGELANFCRVSRLLHGSGIPFLYRSIDLDFSFAETPWTATLLRVLTSRKPGYRQFVFELSARIGGVPQKKNGSGHKLVRAMASQLASLIPILPSLQRFTWDSCDTIPGLLVSHLNTHPTMQEMNIKFAHWGAENLVIPEELRNNLKLKSVSATLLCRDDGLEDDSVPQDLKYLIASSPDLRSLKLRLEVDRPPTIAGQHRPARQVLPFTKSDPVIPLQSLSLECYDFEDTGPTTLLCHISTKALQHLTINYCHSFGRLFDHLSRQPLCLKSVNIDNLFPSPWDPSRTSFASFKTFLLSFKGLESFAITKTGTGELLYTLTGILQHAPSLKYLKLDITDYRSAPSGFENKRSIPSKQLHDIISKCVLIEGVYIHLSIQDLVERGYRFCKILSRTSSLKKLVIRTSPRSGVSSMDAIDTLAIKSIVSRLAPKLWSPKLESFELKYCASDTDPVERISHHWIARKDEKGAFVFTDWCATSNQKWYRRCERLLGEPVIPPDDKSLLPRWEVELERRIEIHGATAPNRLN